MKTIIGANAPTSSTVGAVGQFYHSTNLDSDYICVGTDGWYNWKLVGGWLKASTQETNEFTEEQTFSNGIRMGSACMYYDTSNKCIKFSFD